MSEKVDTTAECPAEAMLKSLSGKWKPQILRLADEGTLRFNSIMKVLQGANKQSVSVALKELEEEGILSKTIVSQKPLHIEYSLTDKGRGVIPLLLNLGGFAQEHWSAKDDK